MKKYRNIAVIICVLIALGLIVFNFIPSRYEKTDDAQIEQYISPVNIKVAGYIKEICFTEHQHVNKGDTLLIIDNREFLIALKQAEAMLLDAESGRKVVGNTINTATSTATVFDSSIDEAQLKVDKLQRDFNRYSALLKKNATTPIIVEQYETELEIAKRRLSALVSQRKAALSSVSEITQRQENAEALIMRAEAAVDLAKLNLSYTVITAPCDGVLGRRAIETGQLVGPGQSVTTIIPDTPKWVIANFKETQTARLRIGQTVDITIDAMPEHHFKGVITAISAATGSKYSMIPTDNSAGNFVKVQQRIPFRIDFIDISQELNNRMVAGMMCIINVDTES